MVCCYHNNFFVLHAFYSLMREYAVILLIGRQSIMPIMIFTDVYIAAMISSIYSGISKLFFIAPITPNMPSNIAGR